MSEYFNPDRRHFLGTAVMTLAAARLGPGVSATSSSVANTANEIAGKSRSRASFDTVKQIDAGVLNIGYAEAGPANGPPVILLHGWPYDIHSYEEVAPLLAAKGYRVIIPYLRGYGSTRFLSGDTIRNGQQSALAVDTIALMDALKIQKAIVGGFDWGARTADIMAALWPERCKALVSVSGYLIVNLQANQQPLPPKAELGWWYQYYFSTERGRAGYDKYRQDFNKLIWTIASPKWKFDEPGPRRDRHPQLPLASESGEGRAAVRRAGAETLHRAGDQGADNHDFQRFRRCGRGRLRLSREILRPIFAQDPQWHRPQRAPGSS